MNMITKINVKLAEDELYLNTLNIYNTETYYFTGITHPNYSTLEKQVAEVIEQRTLKTLIQKLKMNNCTTRISGIDFHL